METKETRYTNVFVDILSGDERDCGHKHHDEIEALSCSLGSKAESEAVITYRDDAEGRWQYLGRWALIESAT